MIETFPPGHFYSPIPDISSLDVSRFNDAFTNIIDLDVKSILAFAEKTYSHSREFASRIERHECDFEWSNSQFPPADSLAYYGVLRELKPQRIIEIGSGFSTQVAVEAIEYNQCGQIDCIEPYPREFLRDHAKINLIEKRLQDVPDDAFKSLRAGDVLFIDSSHQVKCQSDVLDIFFRVLELLDAGVIIHFHDIFIPDDYPAFWLQKRGVFFNEQYFLLAFLKNNNCYRCLLPNAFIIRKNQPLYEQWVADIHNPADEAFVNLEHGFIKGGSFWIEKIC